MRIITDKSFSGEEGMVKVWNPLSGPVQVTDDGHLLDGMTSAWIDDNETLRELIEVGNAVLLEGTPKKSTKKNSKQRIQENKDFQPETSPMFEEVSDHLLAAPAEGGTEPEEFRLDDSTLL